jgi:hypothetical protein
MGSETIAAIPSFFASSGYCRRSVLLISLMTAGSFFGRPSDTPADQKRAFVQIRNAQTRTCQHLKFLGFRIQGKDSCALDIQR